MRADPDGKLGDFTQLPAKVGIDYCVVVVVVVRTPEPEVTYLLTYRARGAKAALASRSDFSKRKRSAAISNGGCDGRRSFGRSTRAHSELLAA